MNRWGVIDQNTNIVVNVIIWNGVDPWKPPANTYVILSEDAEINWIYNPQDGTFTNPNSSVED
jgi:hypothetical protein